MLKSDWHHSLVDLASTNTSEIEEINLEEFEELLEMDALLGQWDSDTESYVIE